MLAGLARVPDAAGALRSILDWTGGQPFLTQKVCHLVREDRESRFGTSAEWVDHVVRTHVIENWEMQDEPQHLRTIRDRIVQADEARRGAIVGGLSAGCWAGGVGGGGDSWEQAEFAVV
ncbi:MAG: hypothetical protein HC860_25860, partial [Alkalinema sp. RU_4_3]|nr:hypothetical protein [Alkalinema sp. RU_4_3]